MPLLCQPRSREEAPVLTATEEGLETIIATGYNACEHVRPANGTRGKAADRTLRCCGEVESMPKAAIVLNLLFFLPLLAANAILLWVLREVTEAGLWPTEKFFGFTVRRPGRLFSVIKLLRQRIQDAEDPVEVRRYRRWLHAIFLGYGLGLFAFAVVVVLLPWLSSQIP